METKITIAKSCKNIVNMKLYFVEGNRDINWEHVNKIKKAMMAGVNFPPLEVDAIENIIIDGQHRYEAAKELWEEGIEYPLLCHFYNSDNPLLDAINFNNTQISWRLEDYIKAYIANENENYIKFMDWIQEKPLLAGRFNSAVKILGSSNVEIKRGTFKFPEDTSTADVIYEELATFRNNNLFHHSGVSSWIKIRDYILNDITFEAYYILWKQYFIFPSSTVQKELMQAFLNVINR